MPDISLRHLTKQYDDQPTTIQDLNLEIKDREFVVLVGPSGCGKSTTLRMIAGLESITAGELAIDDQIMNEVASKDRDISMVFQSYALFPHLSVYENIGFGLHIRKYKKAKIKTLVNDTAAIVGLEKVLDKKPKELSGGQRQRVALARAIVKNSHIFLMDEPLSNLDAKLRTQMRAEIIKLHHRLKSTTVYVTHDQIEALTMADKIVVMNAGEIQQVGTPLDVFLHPVNQFVAGFIGTPAMNFIAVSRMNNHLFANALPIATLSTDYHDLPSVATMGIRADAISIVEQGGVPATVNFTELTGSDLLVNIKIGDIELFVKTESGRNYLEGDQIQIELASQSIYLFDGQSQQTIYAHGQQQKVTPIPA